MFDHVTIRVADRAAAVRFYNAALGELGVPRVAPAEQLPEWDDFSLAQESAEKPATHRLHIGFVAPSRAHVDAFYAAGLAAGGADDGPPGPRPEYRDDYYGGFLRDGDDNSAEAVVHGALRSDGVIDHLWVRVADLEASKRFYATIAPYGPLQQVADAPTLVRYRREGAAGGSLTLVQAETPAAATANLHIAFPAGDEATVQAFHAAAVGAGYRDDGAPGPRPQYSPGYYGAFVLDPDGNSVELVHHGG